ncbi:MAG: hypothetical protein D6679_04170 [Candidatus Hydrogenedentota bacterium]|nr:MAG: hypothetical protein D6679_04170 [Candidatus Hydrogenedentota bacterium]
MPRGDRSGSGYRLKYGGNEYGPFSREEIQRYINLRGEESFRSADAVFDPTCGSWIGVFEWLKEGSREESAPEIFAGVTVSSAYQKVTIAGVILFLFWGLAMIAVRLDTGHWPGANAPRHHNPVPVGIEPDNGKRGSERTTEDTEQHGGGRTTERTE